MVAEREFCVAHRVYKTLHNNATGQPDAARNNGNRAAESISSKSARIEKH